MNAYVHVLILACIWQGSHYVANQSTASQFEMEVYLKEAANLDEAMNSPTKWIKQPYTIPWTKILSQFWWDTEGFEIQLYSNDYEGEAGITAHYRYMAEFKKWYYARIMVPHCDNQWSRMYPNQDSEMTHRSFFFRRPIS